MARAYAFCAGSAPFPAEMELARAVRAFGVKAVTGRDTLTAREIRDCMTADFAEKVIGFYRAREASGNWAEWEVQHAHEARALKQVQEAYTND
jgi:hypothetical protein